MAAPVIVRFQVEGIEGVKSALRSVEDAFLRSDKRTEDSSKRTSRSRLNEEEKLAREKIRVDERSAKDRDSIAKREQQEAIKHSIAAVREFDKGEKDKTAAAERWSKARARIVDNSIAMEQRAAKKKADDEIREAKRAHDARVELATRLGHAGFHGAMAGMGRVAGVTGHMASTALGLGGGFSVADSMHRAMGLSTLATDIAIQGHVTSASGKAENRIQRSGNDVEGQIRSASIDTGLEAEDVGKGLQKFTNLTGDLSLGLQLLPQLAKMAAATGTSFDDMAQSAGNISKSLEGTKDPAKGTMEVLKSMAGAGRENSIELKDFAVQVAKVAAAAGKFEGGSTENIIKMSALMQGARGGGGAWNAASAATAVNSFGATFGKNARREKFKKYGVEIDGKDGKTRDPFEIIADSVSKSKGNAVAMNEMFGSVMTDRAVRKYVGTYSEAEKKETGSGRAAVMTQLKDVAGAKLSDDEIDSNLKMKMNTDAAQMGKVKAEFDKAISTDLLPLFTALIPVIKDMVPVFVDLSKTAIPAFAELIKSIADFANANKGIIRDIAAHPVGAIMAAELAKSIGPAIANAGISDIFQKGIGSSFAKGGLIIGAATLAVEMGTIAIDKLVNDENKGAKDATKDQNDALELTAKIKSGKATPDDIDRARRLSLTLGEDSTSIADQQAHPSMAKRAFYKLQGLVDPAEENEAKENDKAGSDGWIAQLADTNKALLEAIKANTSSLHVNTEATKGNTGDGGAAAPAGANRTTTMAQVPNMSGGAQQK